MFKVFGKRVWFFSDAILEVCDSIIIPNPYQAVSTNIAQQFWKEGYVEAIVVKFKGH